MQWVTDKAINRRGKFETAVAEVKPKLVDGWGEFQSGDEALIDEIGLDTEEREVSKIRDGQTSEWSETWFVIPARLRKATSILHQFVDIRLGGMPDPVVETYLADKRRTVFQPMYVDRLQQKMFAHTIEPWVEPRLLSFSHAYRRKRSRWSALIDARTQVRKGFNYLAKTDVKRFFPSISVEMALRGLELLCPEFQNGLLEGIDRAMRPEVARRPSHPERRRGSGSVFWKPTGHLLQGTPLASLLSNVAGHFMIDLPFQDAVENGEVRAAMIRYADDLLIAGESENDTDRALEIVRQALGVCGLRLNERKTTEPVDVLRNPIRWLGKELRGKHVRTPREDLERYIERFLNEESRSRRFRAVASWVSEELQLESDKTRRWAGRELKRRSKDHELEFASAIDRRRTRLLANADGRGQ